MKVPEVLPKEEVRGIERERGSVPSSQPLPNPKPLGREHSSMNDGSNIQLAGSSLVQKPTGSRFEQQLQHKSLAQTVSEARQTLFDVSRTARPAATLPPGKRSVFNAFVKAQHDISAKSMQAPQPAPAPNDPGVVPSSYTPGSGSQQWGTPAAPTAGAGPMSSTTSPANPTSAMAPAETKRGLIGLLFSSRNQVSKQESQ